MKKKYYTPDVQVIDLVVNQFITASIVMGDEVESFDAGEYRSDWENIWANM